VPDQESKEILKAFERQRADEERRHRELIDELRRSSSSEQKVSAQSAREHLRRGYAENDRKREEGSDDAAQE
jgi:hypothetical protein